MGEDIVIDGSEHRPRGLRRKLVRLFRQLGQSLGEFHCLMVLAQAQALRVGPAAAPPPPMPPSRNLGERG